MNTSAVRWKRVPQLWSVQAQALSSRALIKVMEQQFRRQQPGSGNRKRKREKAFQHDALCIYHIQASYEKGKSTVTHSFICASYTSAEGVRACLDFTPRSSESIYTEISPFKFTSNIYEWQSFYQFCTIMMFFLRKHLLSFAHLTDLLLVHRSICRSVSRVTA